MSEALSRAQQHSREAEQSAAQAEQSEAQARQQIESLNDSFC
jgi:hypothetical protein